MSHSRGFTIIELLVVISIIGLLSTVILASLNSARLRARDARRVSDLKQLQVALELYFDKNDKYPSTLNASLLTPTYIAVIPNDPSGTAYGYAAFRGSSPTVCASYHLGAALEDPNNAALNSDADLTAGALGSTCTGSGSDFNGTVSNVYDLRSL